MTSTYLESGAVLSDDAEYRYTLTRSWDRSTSTVTWVMLNPSTADAAVDDATIRKCVTFSRDWGHGALIVVNLFAHRATDPEELARAADPIGPENDEWIVKAALDADLVMLGWGGSVPPRLTWRPPQVRHLLRKTGRPLYHLGLTRYGAPRHPLYMPSRTQPILLERAIV